MSGLKNMCILNFLAFWIFGNFYKIKVLYSIVLLNSQHILIKLNFL
jgi:hypothetical protein